MMIKCKEFVKTVSTGETLTFAQSLKLRFHRLICVHCRKYYQQLTYLHKAIRLLINKRISIADVNHIKKIEDSILDQIKK